MTGLPDDSMDFGSRHPIQLPGDDYKGAPEVHSPKHYQVFPGIQAIQIIAQTLTEEEFYGYCLGNVLKYRLRVGKKDNVDKEIGKADKYIELYNSYKHLCRVK